MIDLKTVKEIRISEGSVTKITDSSGVVLWQKVVTPSVPLDVDLNNQWVESTKTLDDYKVYMSNSNKGVDNGYASMKFKFKGIPDFKLWINSYAEGNFDYTIAWDMDVNYPSSNPQYNSTGVKAHTRGNQKDPTTIDKFTEVDYANDGGEHFVVVTYRKDSSYNSNDDRGYVAVKLTLISTTWVVSATEFIKKDDKYYQRLNEVGTYTDGSTANTGNYKEGNELPVTYKQGTADDYMIVGGNKYYKKYAYVTPKDQEINTGDYIQGDYIGHITNAMYVKYLDDTEKIFTGLTTIKQDTDPNKKNAKEIIIYDGVTSIGDWAFGIDEYHPGKYQSCTSLTSVTIPDSVTSIGAGAFNKCLSLTDITIPNSVTSIGEYSFSEIKITSITIPNSITSISRGAFENCSKLESVTIQNSTSKISYDSYAFANISSTAKLYVPSNLLSSYQSDTNWTNAFKGGIYAIPSMKVKYVDGTENKFYGLTSIKKDTDSNKANAKEVEIYDGVTIIDNNAFQSCTNLESVTFSNSLIKIGDYAFDYCPKLTNIILPNRLERLGLRAFATCGGLTSVEIGSGLTDIGERAFYSCTGLTNITLPSNVGHFSNYAFQYCSSLASVTIENSDHKLAYNTYNADAFANISSSAKLYVPSNLLSQYQADTKYTNAFKGGIFAIGS